MVAGTNKLSDFSSSAMQQVIPALLVSHQDFDDISVANDIAIIHVNTFSKTKNFKNQTKQTSFGLRKL